jgi:DNA replicative helicase MCM subunit Mcm2 (Cdc46/Mcm family)
MTYKQLSEYFRLSDGAIRAACKKYVKREDANEKQ